jgi:hypothetical protein
MCWNENVSLNTYIFGLFASIFGYLNNKITLYGFIVHTNLAVNSTY